MISPLADEEESTFHDLQDAAALAFDSLRQLARVAAVGPDQLKPREVLLDRFKYCLCAVPTLETR